MSSRGNMAKKRGKNRANPHKYRIREEIAMFEKFGEFDSVEELNLAAEGFRSEGDMESLYALAEENGIDKEDAEDYADRITDELATPMMAAIGRLKVERGSTGTDATPLGVIVTMTSGLCDDPDIQAGIMKKGRRAEAILDAMKEAAKKHAFGNTGVCCGTDKQLKDIIRAYYTQTQQEFEKKIEALYEVAAR